MRATMLLVILAASGAAQSGGHIAPDEAKLRSRMQREWVTVQALRPEDLPASTPASHAVPLIDAASAARDRYLRTKEAVQLTESAHLRFLADYLAQGTGAIATLDLDEDLADLDRRRAKISERIAELASRTDQAALVESGNLKSELQKINELGTALKSLREPARGETSAADVARTEAMLAFRHLADEWEALAKSTSAERSLWRDFYDAMRRRFCQTDQPDQEDRACITKP